MAGLGIALVVMILFILFGFVDGMRRTVASTAETGNFILLSIGSEDEPNSVIMEPAFELLRNRPCLPSHKNQPSPSLPQSRLKKRRLKLVRERITNSYSENVPRPAPVRASPH